MRRESERFGRAQADFSFSVLVSGDEVFGADVLVLAQSCKSLSEISLRRCSLDETVMHCLEQRGIKVS